MELLLVISLLAAVAGALAGSWRGSAEPGASAQQWQQLDAWARMQARSGQVGFWRIEDDRVVYSAAGMQLREAAIRGWRLHDLAGDPLERVGYDASGWRQDVLLWQEGRWWRSGGVRARQKINITFRLIFCRPSALPIAHICPTCSLFAP